jgi:bile acid:Na+ symporter, BASS family
LLVVEALAAIVFVPGAVAVCGLVFHNEAHVGISAITLIILVTVLLPLAIGMLLSRFAPKFAEQISDPVGRVGSLMLLIGLAGILLISLGDMVSLVGDGTIVAIVAFFVLGMTVGHALGGPKPEERAVLALASAARHPGIALAILTANLPDHKSALAAILLSVVVSMIVPIPYLRWIKPRMAI